MTFLPLILKMVYWFKCHNNMLVWKFIVTRKHFWRRIFGICEVHFFQAVVSSDSNNAKH